MLHSMVMGFLFMPILGWCVLSRRFGRNTVNHFLITVGFMLLLMYGLLKRGFQQCLLGKVGRRSTCVMLFRISEEKLRGCSGIRCWLILGIQRALGWLGTGRCGVLCTHCRSSLKANQTDKSEA